MPNKFKLVVAFPMLCLALTACGDGLSPYAGPQSAVAIARDRGTDSGVLEEGVGAVVYDPDGCQGWLIDDGIEGYSGRRFDPVSGLPICNNQYPPGTVLGNYTTRSEGLRDFVPGRVVRDGTVSQQTYQVQGGGSTGGANTFGN